MEFSVNHPIIFVLVGIVLLIVLGQSVFFLVRAIKRAKDKGMDMGVIKRTIKKAAVFTIAPAVSILLGVIALSRALGLPLPWLRLSVIGSLTYEQTAAANALDAIGTSFAELAQVIGGITAEQYITVAIVMTLGIIPGIIGVPLFCKNVEGGLMKIQSKDRKWGDILVTALFMGMISAFLGFIFCDVSKGLSGWIPVFVMLVSAAVMAVCGILMKKFKLRWMGDYALPISMLASMAAAIPITQLIVGGVW